MSLRVSSSIKPFEEKALKTWQMEKYKWPRDIFKPVIFLGMYHILDYARYLAHFGKKIVIWCGSDILNLLETKVHWEWMFGDAEHYCENEVEQEELRSLGIEAKIVYTFLEDVNDFPVSYKQSDKPKVYLSYRKGNRDAYGVDLAERLAKEVPEVEFHIFDGTVSPEQFNEEIKNYQCGLRLNKHDGFSEIIAKSALMGQWPISRIKYPHIDSYETEEELIALLKDLKNKIKPNYEASNFYRKSVNNFSTTQYKK